MRIFLLSLITLLVTTLSAQNVILTGILDGDLRNANDQGGNPKVIELYVNGSVDLTGYQLSRTNNDDLYVFPAGSSYNSEFVYLVGTAGQQVFIDAFGASGDFANLIGSGEISFNGDDPYALLSPTGIVLDQAYGTGSPTHSDGFYYRNDNTGPDGGWIEVNWTRGSVDNLPIADYPSTVPFGTYSATPPGPSVLVDGTTNGDEDGTNGVFTISLSEISASDVTVSYTFSGTATQNVDFLDSESGSVTITAGQTSRTVTLAIVDDPTAEPTETIILTVDAVSDMTFAAGGSGTIDLLDNEPVSALNIGTVQGSGFASPLVGQTVTVEGIVVGDFQGSSGVGLGGFFVQEEDADADLDPSTSNGIWVFDNAAGVDIAEGDLVTVTGLVEEQNDLTQINTTTGTGAGVVINSSNNALPTPAQLDLPVASENAYEDIEGMLTTVIDDVTVTETFRLGQFGEFGVAEGERLIQFTECNDSDPAALAAYNDAQDLRRLTVDDGRSGENAFPILLGDGMEVTATNTLRSGTIITGLTGVVDERFTGYRLQATDFDRNDANPRPTSAPAVGGNLTIVGMNVLNYFTTLGSRGADDADEFDRQEAKIVNAIIELDADIIGLAEIENNGFGAGSAVQTLITAISDAGGPTYTAVVNPNPGGDQIQVAMIYKGDVVEESGTAANLATPADVFSSNRVPLAQTFRITETANANVGQQITVCINHWKAKGGSCGAGDDDNGGAGSCNGTRDAAARAIADWLQANPTGITEPDQLIIGDLNAYSNEEPLQTLEAEGYVDMVRALADPSSFPCGSVPSYVFRGEWGSLDHAFASASLSALVTGATPWNVNSPEPRSLGYDTEFDDPGLYADDFYRFSDHDPIVIGVDLGATLPAELTAFTGEENNGDVDLKWTTASEVNTDRFGVERRTGNSDFVALGTVTAAGNSTTSSDYAFTDTDPTAGDNDYRLRIVDLDGSEAFSNVVTVNVDATTNLSVGRNGARNYRLSGARPGTQYLLTDAAGAVLRRGTVTTETEDLDGAHLPAGVYFLVIEGRQTFKLLF